MGLTMIQAPSPITYPMNALNRALTLLSMVSGSRIHDLAESVQEYHIHLIFKAMLWAAKLVNPNPLKLFSWQTTFQLTRHLPPSMFYVLPEKAHADLDNALGQPYRHVHRENFKDHHSR